MSVGGKCLPMSPSPAAPSSASVKACATASASECPSSPRSCGISTPARISFRPSAKRCESYPMPMRIVKTPPAPDRTNHFLLHSHVHLHFEEQVQVRGQE